MNIAQMNKPNNIKHMPTELIYNLNTRVKRLRKQGNISRLLIMTLIIWNVTLTIGLVNLQKAHIMPQFSISDNAVITHLEGIPIDELAE